MAPECVPENSFKFSRRVGACPRGPPSYGRASHSRMTRSPPNFLHTPFCPPPPLAIMYGRNTAYMDTNTDCFRLIIDSANISTDKIVHMQVAHAWSHFAWLTHLSMINFCPNSRFIQSEFCLDSCFAKNWLLSRCRTSVNRRRINSRNLRSTKILICDHILENQPVSKKVNYCIRVEIVVRARKR